MASILSVQNISKSYVGLQALTDVNIEVENNIIKGLIGPNGAGKTTLFNVISGFIPANSGSIMFEGEDITGLKPYVLARKGISRTFQSVILDLNRTVKENIIVAVYCNRKRITMNSLFSIRKLSAQEKEDMKLVEGILEILGLSSYGEELVKNIPFGLRHFLEIGRCLATDPKVVLLDEPTTGLNNSEQNQIMKVIKNIRDTGKTVFIVEHNMKVIMNICDDISVLDNGKTIADGPPSEIRTNKKVIESYLGKEAHNA